MMSDDHDLDVQALPLDAWHRARGARMVAFAGYSMPIQYEGILAEHNWTREHAGLFDVSHMGQLVLSGEAVDAALETMLPGDIKGLGVDRMRYSLLLDDSGGIIDDLMVTRRADDVYMVVNGATKQGDVAYLRERLPGSIALVTLDSHGLLALQGPEAVTALSRLVPGVENLTFMTAGLFGHGEHPLWISRSGYTGEDGFEISLPVHSIEMFASLLADQPEVKPIGLGARDSLRLEAGLPLYGHDLANHVNPAAADLGFAVSKRRRAEGGFPAAHTIIRELAEGAATKRVGFAIEGRLPAREGAEIFAGDRKVGTVTSGGFAPTVGAPIAMGFVEAAHAAPGTPLEIEVRGKRLAAKVTPMPFVPHRYVRKGAPK
jgi:aminomethyltransferase